MQGQSLVSRLCLPVEEERVFHALVLEREQALVLVVQGRETSVHELRVALVHRVAKKLLTGSSVFV